MSALARVKIFIVHEPLLLLLALSWLGFLLALWTGVPQGGDLYPIYGGILALRSGLSPYALETGAFIKNTWSVGGDPFLPTFCVYPLPTLFLFLPLGLLSITGAAVAWKILLALSVILLVWTASDRAERILRLLLFFPFSHVLFIQNASAIFFGLSGAALSRKKLAPVAQGILAFALMLKPQASGIVGLYILYKGSRDSRTSLKVFLALSIIFLGLSFAAQPLWVSDWVEAIFKYREVLKSDPIIIPRLILISLSLGLPGQIAAPVLQFALFPPTDIYSALPLFFVWDEAPKKLGRLGAAFGALSALSYIYPGNSWIIILTLCLPAALFLLERRLSRFKNPVKS